MVCGLRSVQSQAVEDEDQVITRLFLLPRLNQLSSSLQLNLFQRSNRKPMLSLNFF